MKTKRLISVLLLICLLCTVLPMQAFTAEDGTKAHPFTDVPEESWYQDAVQYVYEHGVFSGTSATTFTPDGTMTRGMFVTVLGRMAGLNPEEYAGQPEFLDVPKDEYYAPYVIWASKYGVTVGVGGGRFEPDTYISRQQMATFFVRYFERFAVEYDTGETVSTIPADLDTAAEWAKDPVLKLWRAGLLMGDGINFEPLAYASRAQAAALCMRVDAAVTAWRLEPGASASPDAEDGQDADSTERPDKRPGGGSGGGSGSGSGSTHYYEVRFALGEGMDDSGLTLPETKTYPSGTRLTELPTPYQRGTVFLGWYYDAALKERAESDDAVNKNMTLYAKMTALDQVPFQETPPYLTKRDVGTDFVFSVKAGSADEVRQALTVTQITANNTILTEDGSAPDLTITEEGGLYKVTGNYQAGHTYRARLEESADAVFVIDGAEQPESVRELNFITAKAEVMNLGLKDGLVYLPKEQISGMSDALAGLFAVNVGVSDGIQTVENSGTFTYNGSESMKAGDTAAIYEGARPDERTLYTDNDGAVVYVNITGTEGNSYTYTTADSEDVLFTPDVLPVLSGLDKDPQDGDVLTVDRSALDFTDDKYAVMGLGSQTTVDAGDFIAFYTGDIEAQEGALDGYVQITGVTLTDSEYIIAYSSVSEADVFAAMDIYSTRTESIELTEEQAREIEQDIVTQAEASGFVDEAIDYLSYMATETDGFENLDGVEIVNYSVKPSAASPKAVVAGRASSYENGIKTHNISASIKAGKNVLEHFEEGDGLRAELKLEFEREIEIANGNKLTISMEAVFEQEVLLSINISGGAIWKWAWIIPYIYDFQLNASFDVGTFTGIGVTVSMITGEGDDDDNDDEGNGNFLDVDWGSLVPGGNDVSTDDYVSNLGTQLDKLIEKGQEFMGEDAESEGDDGGEHPLSGLMEQYAEMMGEAEDSWIELVRKEIFNIGGAVDPFHILVYGISADFVVKANVYITLGMTFEYGNAKRYNFSLLLFHRQTTNETINLETEHYEFVFYVMGTLGIRTGVEFEIAVGLFSLKLDSIGITAEVGAYAQLWGYFYYKLSWEAGSERESICAGALHIEIGIYLEIKFKAQLFSSEKLTYNPTLYENQWPIYTIGAQDNVYDFNWSPGGEEAWGENGPIYSLKSVKSLTLPTELFDMAYMDMQTGELGGRDAEDEEENPAINYDDSTESRFAIEMSNPKFKYDPAQNLITIEPDGSIKESCEMTIIWKGSALSFTSIPISLTVTIQWSDPENMRYIAFHSNGGNVVETISAAPGAAITAPEEPVKKGYRFAGWYEDGQPYTIPDTMPKSSTLVIAKWEPRHDTPYKAEYYQQELNGSYSLVETRALTGTTDSPVAPDLTAPSGFLYNSRKSAADQNIAPNGSTVAKIYFDRQKYTLTFTYGDKNDGSLPNVIYRDVKYGSAIYEPKMNLGGYLFSGWENGMTFTDADGNPTQTMPAGDISYAAAWIPDPSTPYRVEYYIQDFAEDKYYYNSARQGTGATEDAIDLTQYAEFGGGFTMRRATVKGTEVSSGDALLKIRGDGSLVIKLYFDRAEYTVSFDSAGGNMVASQTVRHGGKATEPAVPARAGYTFAGWTANGTAWDFAGGTVTGNMTLTAQWIPNGDTTYKVEHYWQNTTGDAETDYTLHTTVTMSGTTDADTAAEAIDYTAEGLQNAKTFTQTAIAADGSTVVKIYYDRKTYKIDFAANGGSPAPVSQTVRHGGKATEPAVPARTGYTFAGWKNGADVWAFDTNTVTGDLTLTASWTANSDTAYTVKHFKENLDGSYPADPAEIEPLYGTTGTNAPVTPKTYEGFGTGTYTDSVIAEDGSTVIEVRYPRNSYTVTWLDFDGTTQLGSGTFKFEETITVPPTIGKPSKRTGYTFADWKDAGVMPAGDRNIQAGTDTAIWTANTYTVTFDQNYDGAPAAGTGVQTYDTKYILPANPVRAGYAFIGWYTEAEGGTLIQASSDMKTAADHTLYAHWELGTATPYMVKHWQQNIDDDAYTESSGDQQILTGTTGGQTQAAAKSYPGFTAKAFTQQSIDAGGNTVVNIYYDRNVHRAIWSADGVPMPVEYRYGAVIAKQADPFKEHYTFTGWQGFAENMTMGDEDVTFTAQWTPKTYAVTLHTNGGTASALTGYTYGVGAVLPVASRTGYTFDGWFDNESLGGTALTAISDTDAGDKAFYAKWTANSYSVAFRANGGTGSMDPQNFAYDETKNLASNAFTRPGYTFTGWNTAEDGTGESYTKDQPVSNLTADNGAVITLYAQWSEEHYTISYELDGGTAENPDSYTVNSADIRLNAPVKNGYTFTGWTGENGTTAQTEVVISSGSTGDKSYTAHWKANSYRVTFEANGGTVSETGRDVTYNSAYGALPEPTRIGHIFDGWYTAPADGTEIFGDTLVTTASNHTLYARWTEETYPITYGGLDGSNTTADTLQTTYTAAGKQFNLPVPAKEGYRFTGWICNSANVTISASDGSYMVDIPENTTGGITITAKWEQQRLTLYDTTGTVIENYNNTDPLPYTLSIVENGTQKDVLVAYWTTKQDGTGERYAPGTLRANVPVSVLCAVKSRPETPMEISSLELLQMLRDKVNAGGTDAALWGAGHYALTCDLTLGAEDWTEGIGVYTNTPYLRSPFSGTFDGNNHKITYDNAGDTLFNRVETANGSTQAAVIQNIHVTGSVRNTAQDAQYLGGVVSYVTGKKNLPAKILNCTATDLTLTSENNTGSGRGLGGIIGTVDYYVDIESCHVTGDNNVFTSDSFNSGGIAGQFMSPDNSIFDCTVENAVIGGKNAGGIAGVMQGQITSCSVANSEISGSICAGGIAGNVLAGSNGQFVGKVSDCTVDTCEITMVAVSTSKEHGAGGIAGYNKGELNGCTVKGTAISYPEGCNGDKIATNAKASILSDPTGTYTNCTADSATSLIQTPAG